MQAGREAKGRGGVNEAGGEPGLLLRTRSATMRRLPHHSPLTISSATPPARTARVMALSMRPGERSLCALLVLPLLLCSERDVSLCEAAGLQMPYGPSAVCEQWFWDVYWKHCSTDAKTCQLAGAREENERLTVDVC